MNAWPIVASGLYHALRFATLSSVRVIDEGGLRDLEGTEPILVVANHQSHADTPVLLSVIPTPRRRRMRFVASAARFSAALPTTASLRQRVEQWFMRGMAIGAYDALLVGSDEGGLRDLKNIEQALESGSTVAMYPEGTRSRDGRLGSLRPGVSILAVGTRVRVAPIRIDGTREALPKSLRVPKFRNRITVRIRTSLTALPSETHAQFTARLAAALAPHCGAAEHREASSREERSAPS